jgi:hypothetical protein
MNEIPMKIQAIDKLIGCLHNSRKNAATVDPIYTSIREFGLQIRCLAGSKGEPLDGQNRTRRAA